jgi:hypothetical protein
LTDGDKEHLYHVIPELWPIAEVNLKELKFLPEVYVRMEQPKNDINYPFWYYQHEHEHGETLILDEFVDITTKNKKIIGWTLTTNKQLSKLNLGTNEEPCIVLVSATLPKQF